MPTQQEKVKELIKLYQRVLGTEEGKKVVHDLCQRYRMLGTTFSPDPYTHAYNAGQRDVILHILEMLELKVVDIERMFSESMNQRTLEWGEQ